MALEGVELGLYTKDTPLNVQSALIGAAILNPEAKVLNFGNIVVRKNYEDLKHVLIVSGGATGTDLSYAQFVGEGMLAAALHGDVGRIPPIKPILQTLREIAVSQPYGVLAVVGGEPGSVLGWGLAGERACRESLRVHVLSLHDKAYPKGTPCGGAGLVLVLKIAGALAAGGMSLDGVHQYCHGVVPLIFTAMDVTEKNFEYPIIRKLDPPTKASITPPSPPEMPPTMQKFCHSLVSKCLEQDDIPDVPPGLNIDGTVGEAPPYTVVVFLNTTWTGLAKLCAAHQILAELLKRNIVVARFYVGCFFFSHKCRGAALTFMRVLSKEVLHHLDKPTKAPGWNQITTLVNDHLQMPILEESRLHRIVKPREITKGPYLTDVASNTFKICGIFACEALISCEKQLNTMDSEKGNGNTGTRLKEAALNVLDRLERKEKPHPSEFPAEFFNSISKTLEEKAGGTLGCAYAILFQSAANTLDTYEPTQGLNIAVWTHVFKNGVAALQKYGKVYVGDNTLLDPLASCVEAWETATSTSLTSEVDDSLDMIECGIVAAEACVMTTKGHNKYPDPGAHSAAVWLRAIFEGVKLRM